MARRKPITKSLRFEVFKRDSFTCQYCGQNAPDVVLEIDHITPVVEGGENDVMNLITSCFDCNRGKGKKLLSDKTAVKMQTEQLKELNKKREQLEMMVKWREELQNLENEQVKHIEDFLFEQTGYGFSEHGWQETKKRIKKYGFQEVYDAAETSVEQYCNPNDEESITKTFSKIGAILHVRQLEKDNPDLKDIYYICGILKNRLSYFDRPKAIQMLKDVRSQGVSIEKLMDIAKTCRNWTEFRAEIYDEVE